MKTFCLWLYCFYATTMIGFSLQLASLRTLSYYSFVGEISEQSFTINNNS